MQLGIVRERNHTYKLNAGESGPLATAGADHALGAAWYAVLDEPRCELVSEVVPPQVDLRNASSDSPPIGLCSRALGSIWAVSAVSFADGDDPRVMHEQTAQAMSAALRALDRERMGPL
jgi:hypothetical protein